MTQDIIRVRNGKGDKPRKGTNYQKFRENYDLIFKRKDTNDDDAQKPK
jgi:hypothetical protein